MMIKASGRSALILAAGLWVCLAGPSQAAVTATGTVATAAAPLALNKNAKQGLRPWKKVARRKSGRLALKPVPVPAGKDADVADDNNVSSSALPPWVANANAQLATAEVPASNVQAMTVRANNMLQAAPDSAAVAQPGTQVVSADQLNDVDRALRTSDSPAPTVVASADVPAAPVVARSNENSTWDQTSLIGKIFIGFGALLTMASAARMFMA
jgi:hypothetical protein